ncbi:MAG TPA: TIGR00725 family protein [Solirubrobacterales bacterium]|nr:TIGR00725 family protein [Solirubrobacterales bacterium]
MSGAAAPSRRRQVAVIGANAAAQSTEIATLAGEVGRRLAEAGAVVVCGGREGVMEAAARGAAEAGGTVIGIVPGSALGEANPFCTHVVASGVGYGRNLAVVGSGEVVIAVGGAWGTLSEIGLARNLGRTVVALRSWTAEGEGEMRDAPGILQATTPAEAVELALKAL